MYKFLKENIDVSCGDEYTLQDYIAYLAHEIKTPINSIYGNLDILRMEENLNNRYLNNAILSTEYLINLLNSTLAIYEMGNDNSVIKTEATTMDELLKYPQGILEWAAGKKSIELRFICNEIVYQYLYLNKAAIQQIIINLVSNAIKYTDEGGRVLCRITEVYLEEKRVKLYIEVEDNGIGMEEAFVLYACDKSAREQRADDVYGNGLGLFLTRQLIENLNGNMEIETKVNYGTRIVVEFEADGDNVIYDLGCYMKKEDEETKVYENINEYSLPKRALVVEDEITNVEVICKYLKILGIETDKAYDGDEVIEIFKMSEKNYYDVILIDINLPKKSGIEAIREIRSLNRIDNEIPIIVMTADILDRHKKDVLSENINGYITKPYSLEDVRSVLLNCQEL